MSYGLIYTVPFATLDNIPCVVEIEKEDYVGASTELTAGATPFTIDIDSEEFLYTPTRFSTAKLQVVGSDYLQSLFSTAYKEFRVTLKKNGVITWCGFIKPELYTQDYTAKTFTLEIECISAMSVLEFIDYSIEGESKKFVSLWNLLQRCISTADGQYDSVFIPHVYASSKAAYSTGENVLANMTLSEQDFFDEDDKPMKLKEVLEEVCKFLNWTCTDWKGDLYFVDVDHSGIYYKYDTQLKDNVETQAKELLVQDIGFVGAGHFLDILPGYNKATVKCSNYPVGQIFPDEDLDRLKLYASQDKQSGDKVTAKRFYYPNVYRLFHYSPQGTALSDEQFEAYKNNPDSLMGSIIIKRCEYKIVNGEPDISNYNWENLIQVRRGTQKTGSNYTWLSRVPILTFESQLPVAAYLDGAVAISCSVQVTENDDLSTDDKKRNGYVRALCEFSIGDYYYNGSEFVNNSTIERFEIKFPLTDITGGGFGVIENTKKLSQPYDDLTGYIIELPKGKPLTGEVKFCMYPLQPQPGNYTQFFAGVGYYIKDLKMEYKRRNDLDDLSDNSDRTYENVLNENYINELDEIEFKISSYNNDGVCYSKVMLGDDYLQDNLYNCILDDTIRPEEMMITRCINHYSATRIKLTQEIKERADLTPITKLSDTFLVSKKFICTGGSIDCKMNRFECIMIEV
ncbi:hypothetical protein BcellWH2_00027 [Bacteroides cellulosilyticus]|jgi:hypothetical protein|uniref:Uncharacterized protein n=1 Tax=Bacteroides cellulosilyticus TaxID=246787 RepID=A0A0P0GGZ9_9BACE|nr:hypothetical protein [Bacteroides cellulosilyticus]ALJ57304.1 hypothetical protein BcellWH2_00027 [Bacteroides cellulosilyticus]DAH41272.1 MAG TPA: hypothetical protein [Caudoviricetes sp.]